ncbi:MAG: hypothetical protein ACTSY1_10740, partial [Alphaproteobacteria bacterium]
KRSEAGRRVPAGDVEQVVVNRVLEFLRDETAIFEAIEPFTEQINERQFVIRQAADLANRWRDLEPKEQRQIVLKLVARIEVCRESIKVQLWPRQLPMVVNPGGKPTRVDQATVADEPMLGLTIQARLKRVGMETRFIVNGTSSSAHRKPDLSLYRVLAQAQKYNAMVMRNQDKTMAELAAEASVGGSYFTRILRLSFLAPDIVKNILQDSHPLELSAKRLVNEVRLPIAWKDQRTRLGTG